MNASIFFFLAALLCVLGDGPWRCTLALKEMVTYLSENRNDETQLEFVRTFVCEVLDDPSCHSFAQTHWVSMLSDIMFAQGADEFLLGSCLAPFGLFDRYTDFAPTVEDCWNTLNDDVIPVWQSSEFIEMLQGRALVSKTCHDDVDCINHVKLFFADMWRVTADSFSFVYGTAMCEFLAEDGNEHIAQWPTCESVSFAAYLEEQLLPNLIPKLAELPTVSLPPINQEGFQATEGFMKGFECLIVEAYADRQQDNCIAMAGETVYFTVASEIRTMLVGYNFLYHGSILGKPFDVTGNIRIRLYLGMFVDGQVRFFTRGSRNSSSSSASAAAIPKPEVQLNIVKIPDPYYDFKVHVDSDSLGIMADIIENLIWDKLPGPIHDAIETMLPKINAMIAELLASMGDYAVNATSRRPEICSGW